MLTTTNGMDRQAIVFADDTAIGWIAPGATATFGNLAAGHHALRARSLDGLERSRSTTALLPAQVRFDLDPVLAQ